MKLMMLAALLGAAAAIHPARAADPVLDGQIFIVTKRGETFRLSQVSVLLYEKDVVAKHLAAKAADAKKILESADAILKARTKEMQRQAGLKAQAVKANSANQS